MTVRDNSVLIPDNNSTSDGSLKDSNPNSSSEPNLNTNPSSILTSSNIDSYNRPHSHNHHADSILKEAIINSMDPVSRSISPSFSQNSSISMSNSASKFHGKRFNGKPPISQVPELLELVDEFIKKQNVTGLAMIARQRGLPPNLRCKIWPILLKSHPFVTNPYVELDDEEDYEAESQNENDNKNTEENSIPYKEVKFDLKKYLRNAERYKPKVLTPDLKDLFEIQEKMFQVIESAIIKFLKKWGSIVHYNSAITWIALGLAEWVPPLQYSQFVLCGRDDIAKNGTKLRNVNDNDFEKLNNPNSSMMSSIASNSETSSNFDSPTFSESSTSSNSFNSPSNTPPHGFKQMSFAEVYERLVLVVLHAPDPSTIPSTSNPLKSIPSKDKELQQLSLLPYTGGSISERISFFLFCMRKLLPELHNYLSEEDCLKGDWILWWLKYSGSKVWSRYDRGRTWDLLLGYRKDCKKYESDLKDLNHLTPEQIRLLGSDLFSSSVSSDNISNSSPKNISERNKVFEDGDYDENNRNDEDKHDRSLSVLTILSQPRSLSQSQEVDKTPTLTSLSLNSPILSCLTASASSSGILRPELLLPSLDDIEPIGELPFSKIHPHVELIFISLAFLKSKEFTIMELDQSEIKTLFGKLSSLKSSEVNSFVSTDDISSNISDQPHHLNNSKKSNRDIENIMVEAGELWRKFLYLDMMNA